MNNTRYPDMYSNFLPLDGKRIRSMSIAYMNEAPLGEVLSVEMAENDGFYYFRTVRSDGKINSEAQIELCEI
jgi:acyl-ACP thioesterase